MATHECIKLNEINSFPNLTWVDAMVWYIEFDKYQVQDLHLENSHTSKFRHNYATQINFTVTGINIPRSLLLGLSR